MKTFYKVFIMLTVFIGLFVNNSVAIDQEGQVEPSERAKKAYTALYTQAQDFIKTGDTDELPSSFSDTEKRAFVKLFKDKKNAEFSHILTMYSLKNIYIANDGGVLISIDEFAITTANLIVKYIKNLPSKNPIVEEVHATGVYSTLLEISKKK
ncbi:MAG: hypothetical protein GY793_10625 [Proteobacteria bacterium]|nr:hypothetical protein [Pseudomonadota bacterium]